MLLGDGDPVESFREGLDGGFWRNHWLLRLFRLLYEGRLHVFNRDFLELQSDFFDLRLLEHGSNKGLILVTIR